MLVIGETSRFHQQPLLGRPETVVGVIALWLLKNSHSRSSQKFRRARMPYKRRSGFWWTFSIPRLGQFFQKRGFFNSHTCLQQLRNNRTKELWRLEKLGDDYPS